MKPSQLTVRMDRVTGDLWLFNERTRQRFKNINSDVLLCLCADLDGAKEVSRDVVFTEPDGSKWAVEVLLKRKEL